MILLFKLLPAALTLLLFVAVAFSADTHYLRCSETPVAYAYEASEDLKCLCTTANAAIAFLKEIGLETSDCITIRIVDNISPHLTHTLLGSCEVNSQEVFILSYAKAEKLTQGNRKVFGVELTEELWCSFAAHELGHAISKKLLNPKIKAHTASEYIAAVTQLSVLHPDTREHILKRYDDVEPYRSKEEMSELYYLLAPNRFAVKCYRHFISLQNPQKFIALLLHEGNGH